MNKRIYLCLAHMSGNEQKYIDEAFRSNWVVPLGPNVDGFEADLHHFMLKDHPQLEHKQVVALSSGTAAIHLALLGCGVGPGDEVCVQSFTFCASCNPIRYVGGVPILIDSEPNSWNMDPTLLEQAIVERKSITGRYPKAIIVVALYGMPYNIEAIMDIANRYGIPVIEDAAEGLGSRFDGQALGTFGEYGVLSFNGNKMITTSGGGALICPDIDSKTRTLFYATQARDNYPYYEHTHIGYNYRLSNICAGIGRGQMTVLNEHIAHHQRLATMYEKALEGISGLSYHANPDFRYESNYWLSCITLDEHVHVVGEEAVQIEVGQVAPNRNIEA
ncbi:MAG: aminotransferase class I/II-fold pyridoxal phosphate-dependent enzyme, partial [Paludibacteraceae bacterium]|nr:aminotransferase class I/II-fold pyridoxal phosphate-dependent enzyme [Paludibacteraceae bacterium]